jgi:hypothetical protein
VKPKVNQPNENRRKILQGSLAAPMVLTVSSASAASVTSFGKCLQRLNGEEAGSFFTSSSDNWFRANVEVVKLQKGAVKSAGEEGWFYFDPGKNQYVNLESPLTPTGIGRLHNGWTKVEQSSRRALVWVEPTSGNQYRVMQVERPSGYTAVTMSCMTSVRPGAIL